MKFTTVIAFIFVFTVGLCVGWFSNPPTTKDLEKSTEQSESGIKDQVNSLTEAEFAEYEKLKTLEEKYKKADEILGKIVAIFIADIGMRIAKPSISIPVISNSVAATPTQAAVPATEPTSILGTPVGSSEPEKKAAINWAAVEKTVPDIRNETDASDFLKQAAISDLSEALKATGRFSNTSGLYETLSGRYSGHASVKRGQSPKEWDVEMTLNANLTSEGLKGRASVRMSQDGKQFSNSRDSGNIKAFREFTNGSSAIMVNAAPGTYFQLYYMKGMNALMGNVYDQANDEGPYNLIGTITLRK